MTNAAAEAWCAENGVAVVPPGRRPYFLAWRRTDEHRELAAFAVGDLLGEAVLAMQAGRTREIELRALAPELCRCSGGEPCPS